MTLDAAQATRWRALGGQTKECVNDTWQRAEGIMHDRNGLTGEQTRSDPQTRLSLRIPRGLVKNRDSRLR